MPTQLLEVKSNRDDGRVVLFERDRRHPGGEAFVAGDTLADKDDWPVVQVYPTPGVMSAIANRDLVEVGEGEESGPDLEDVDGIGPTRANALREELGILTVDDLAGADVNLLGSHFGASEETAQGWVDSAQQVRDDHDDEG